MTHLQLVHPEIAGQITLVFRAGSLKGTAYFEESTYETTLSELLNEGWVTIERPKLPAEVRQ